MRSALIVLIAMLPSIASSQKMAATFQDATAKGISIHQLDEKYMSALHSDATKAAFAGKEKEFTDGYVSLLTDLSAFLKKNGFTWGKKVRCFNRIYLDKNGEIDYFLFNFKEGEIEKSKEEEFSMLLSRFIQTYKFPLTNEVKFAQCSPVSYND